MNNKQNNQERKQVEEMKGISKWVSRYAHHRAGGPMFIFDGIAIVLFIVMCVLLTLAGRNYRAGDMIDFWIYLVLFAIVLVAILFLSMPWWGGKLAERLAKRLYAKDGEVAATQSIWDKHQWVQAVLVIILFCGIFISVHLEKQGYIPRGYYQPFSAIWIVPLMIVIGFCKRPALWPMGFLWPILYAFHAIMMLLDVWPFNERRFGLDFFVPTFGYGFLTGLAGYIYSRFATRKLKRITRMGHGEAV